jgi:hypothetical protein
MFYLHGGVIVIKHQIIFLKLGLEDSLVPRRRGQTGHQMIIMTAALGIRMV